MTGMHTTLFADDEENILLSLRRLFRDELENVLNDVDDIEDTRV